MTEKLHQTVAGGVPFKLEISRYSGGMRIVVDGIIGIGEFSEECITLKSHSGRITISGQRLKICIFESRAVEICGRVEEISFAYGKNK